MKTKAIFLLAIITLTSFTSEQETATVFLVRKGLYSSVAPKIFMDGKIICEIANNSYSKHTVPVGTHKFNAQWYSKKSKEKTEENAVEIEMTSGQVYYLQIVKHDKGLTSYVHMEEVTANTWKKLNEKGLEEDDCH